MPTPSLSDAKVQQIETLETQTKQLDDRISNLTQRMLALQDDAEARRIEMSKAYRARFEKRYADLDVARSLAGYDAHHDAKVMGAVYRLRPPKQQAVLDVEKFCATAQPAVSASERAVLAWLVGVGAEKEVRSLTELSLADRLAAVRRLPEALLVKLADECNSIDTYLGVVLELELGNS